MHGDDAPGRSGVSDFPVERPTAEGALVRSNEQVILLRANDRIGRLRAVMNRQGVNAVSRTDGKMRRSVACWIVENGPDAVISVDQSYRTMVSFVCGHTCATPDAQAPLNNIAK